MLARRTFLTSVAALALLPAPAGGEANGLDRSEGAGGSGIAPIVLGEIATGRIAGAVVLVGDRDRILYRRAFGNRLLGSRPRPMTPATIFDLASVTKVVATTPAVMQLVDAGRLDLDMPVARYWPAFGFNGKGRITLRQLLSHCSGLRADLSVATEWRGYNTAMAMILAETPIAPAGERYLYSSINFEVLGEIVRRVTATPLDRYCKAAIYSPLRMTDTMFLPPARLHDRIAPTEDHDGLRHWGEVHDATSRWMGGVAGHAGVFSTVDDLSRYARMVLGGGSLDGTRILSAGTVQEMARRQSPPGGHARGLGWELGGTDGFAGFPPGSYGHLGFTGTMIWIDPGRGRYAAVLTNRTYPDGKGDAGPLRRAIMGVLASDAS